MRCGSLRRVKRISIPLVPQVATLATLNRRSIASEVMVAIDKHLEENQDKLKSGAKMPKTSGRKTK